MANPRRFLEWLRDPRTQDGLQTLVIAVLIQGVLPLCAFLPEYMHTGTLSNKTLGAGSTLYILGLGLACRGKLPFVLGLVAGVLAAVVYGADPTLVDQTVATSSRLAWGLIGVVGTAFVVDRFKAHVLLFEGFGPFMRKP